MVDSDMSAICGPQMHHKYPFKNSMSISVYLHAYLTLALSAQTLQQRNHLQFAKILCRFV